MAEKNMNAKISVEFEETANRQQLSSGDNLPTLFGKIKKIISDLANVAFSGSYNDLSDTPDVVTKEYVDPIKSQAAINRTTLGTQCKNLLKNNAATKTVNGVTFTVNDDGSVTVNGTNTSSSTGANLEICGFKNYGTGKLTASLKSTDSNVYMSVFDKNWVGVGIICDNEVTWYNGNKERYVRLVVKPGATINNVTVYPMIRYADITDDTYEPYKPSVKEQAPYSISLPSKSTSASYSYNGVPTLICLTPSESVSSGGGLYLINSVGTAVYLIDKTGIVVNTNTTNKTFTITNNTASTYDVYISCAYKKE